VYIHSKMLFFIFTYYLQSRYLHKTKKLKITHFYAGNHYYYNIYISIIYKKRHSIECCTYIYKTSKNVQGKHLSDDSNFEFTSDYHSGSVPGILYV